MSADSLFHPGSESWHLLMSGPGSAAANMAWDEALLEAASRLARPVLRFYSWTEPAASFGYAQRYSEVARWTALRPLVRRPTGGGLVPHETDWTYSLVFPPAHGWYGLKAVESYERVHTWIHAAFAALRVATRLSSECQIQSPGCCFAGAERFDLLWEGRKIAGAAQRRSRDGLLIQGSIQPGALAAKRLDWERAMREAVPCSGAVQWITLEPDGDLRARIGELERSKYSTAEYNRRRQRKLYRSTGLYDTVT